MALGICTYRPRAFRTGTFRTGTLRTGTVPTWKLWTVGCLILLISGAVATAAQAQSGTLFALRNPGDGGRQLVSLDTTTGAVTVISASISPPLPSASGIAALDAAGGRFFFVGTVGGGPDSTLFTLDTTSGAVLHSPVLVGSGSAFINSLEYDNVSGVLLAVRNPGDGGRQVVSIDPALGTITTISASISPPLPSSSGVSALDAAGGRIFFTGTAGGGPDSTLFTIDTTSGAVLHSPLLVGSGAAFIAGLEYDDINNVLLAVRNPGDGGRQVVSIDPVLGTVTTISGSISPPLPSAGGISALDAAAGRIFFIGTVGAGPDSTLFSVDTASGVVLDQPLLVGSAAMFLMALDYAAPSLVINEIDYDQPGTDAAEFIEIKNTGTAAVDLSLMTLQLVNGASGAAVVYNSIALPPVMLAGGDYFVVCANAATVANCDLDASPDTNFIQNGAPDAVAILQGATILDTVSYEGNTLAPYTEGSGAGLVDDSSLADMGISRCPDGTDSDQNNADLAFALISPGVANECPAPELVINEIDYDQPGTDAAEFIEILNVGSAAADLSTFQLELINGSTGAGYNTIALPAVSLAAGDYFVVCGNSANVPNCDLDVSPDTDLIQNGSPDAVALTQGGLVVDTVSYEGDTVAPYTEGSGVGLEDSAATGNDDMGISRCPDGQDTDQNNVDLEFQPITPGAASDCDGGGGPGPATLVVNEIDYDQPGTDAAEFVEIYNTGPDPVDLNGISLEMVNGTGGGAAVYQSFPLPAVTLGPGEYFVVCGNAANTFGCNLDVTPDTNLIQNGAPDAVALVQGMTIIDTVSYEGDTGAPYTEGSGSLLVDSSSSGDDNKGISRLPNGTDTDQNNVDLTFVCITPGAANTADTSDCPSAGPPSLVVNEIDYDQPGADTAEFVEIHNTGTGAADLTGVELQLVNGTGGGASVYQTIALPSVSLGAGGYFVVCSNAATVANCDLATISSIQNGAPDAVALVKAGAVIDTVSYEGDTGAPYTEGSGSGLEDSGSTGEDNKGVARVPNGTDTDQNNVDLTFVCITPGGANTSVDTGCSPVGPILEIFQIQGSGEFSPFAGQTVGSDDNVVTALGTDGFFIQTPTARSDGDVDTSDGIFVFTGGAPTVSAGEQVDVSGQVVEFFGFTEFTSGTTVSVDGPGAPVPAPVVFNATVPSPDPTAPSCAVEYECYESMLVEVTGGAVSASNQRFGTDPVAEVHVVAGPNRAFREPGVEFPGLSMPPIPTWDGNPEVFELDPDKLGLPNQIIPAGSSYDATGVVGFEFGGYELWPASLTVTPAPLPVAVRERAADEFTVGSLNMFRYFDDVDDPSNMNSAGGVRDDFVVSTAEYQRRTAKFVQYILGALDAPDVLAVQEVEKLEVLQDLAAAIAAVDPSVVYTSYLEEGNDIGTIDVGFMVRDTVQVDAVTQLGANEMLPFDGSLLHDRPPLLLEGSYLCSCDDAPTPDSCADAPSVPLQVMNLHLRSLSGIDSSTDGDRVRHKRLAQAQSVAEKVQAIQTADPDVRLMVIGDFNAFQFTDGYVDVTGQIKGDFVPAMNLLSGPDLVNPNLADQIDGLPADEQYSFIFGGSAQVLDHGLTTVGFDDFLRGTQYGRGNADAAVDLINDEFTPLRSSDHDGLVVYLATECPRQLKTGAIAVLSDLLPTGNFQADHRIEKAIDAIEDSLATDLWVDGLHLDEKHGHKVFDEEKKAVKELLGILDEDGDSDSDSEGDSDSDSEADSDDDSDDGSEGATVDPADAETIAAAIMDLVEADVILATIALDDAIAAAEAAGCEVPHSNYADRKGGGACSKAVKEIATAQEELAEAKAEVLAGEPDKAIDHLKKAWEHANNALDALS